jgi:hypothetical protein
MLNTLCFSSSIRRLIHNAFFFGSCIIRRLHTAKKPQFIYFFQQIYVQNSLNFLQPLGFYSSIRRLLHNDILFGSCIIRILYTGCAKI